MKTNDKKTFLPIILSAGLALLTMVAATFVCAILVEKRVGQYMPYIIYDLLIAIGCFFIIKQNPRSIWYVPLICNAFGIFTVLLPDSLNSHERILIYSGWVLSLIVSRIGAQLGKRTASRSGN
jgi:uncharacterized membrane protein YwaF